MKPAPFPSTVPWVSGERLTFAARQWLSRLLSTDGDIEVTTPGGAVILQSPNGARWRVTVSDAGALVVAAA